MDFSEFRRRLASLGGGQRRYANLAALRPVRDVIERAAHLLDKKSLQPLTDGLAPLAGAAVGAGTGAAAGAVMMSAGAASGTAGAAAMTSALAAAGSIVGGGMAVGLAVVATPAVVLTAAGALAAHRYNTNRLRKLERLYLQRAIQLRDAMAAELQDANTRNEARLEVLQQHLTLLKEVIRNLEGDLGSEDEPVGS
jgi:hypothetical protein